MEIQLAGEYDQRETTARGILVKREDFLEREDAAVTREGGLLDRSTALYFYKRLKTSLHKPRGNFLENLFSTKCAFKKNLQLLEKKFLSQTNKTPKNGI
jgi:hypothetical protein